MSMQRVIDTWLQEFGYLPGLIGLEHARRERGNERLQLELDIHAKRLAHEATMARGKTFVTGRAGVIPR